MFARILTAAAFAALSITTASAGDRPAGKVTVVFDHPLPNVPGKSMKGVLVEYGPGGGSPAHTHPKSAFIYATVLKARSAAASTARRKRSIKQAKTSTKSQAPITR
jgi:hypothetical protein